MKRALTLLSTSAVVLLAFGAAALAQSNTQSLGDYARSVRKTKDAPSAAAKPVVYENDNLPKEGTVSVIGNASAPDAQSAVTDSKDANAASDKDKLPQIKAGQSSDERKQAIDAWKDKLKDQQAKIDSATRDLDMLQRDYRVKAAEYYADTARRTQNPTGFAKEDADYKKQIADKQAAVDAAKAKLTDLQEQARKSGAPNSVTDSTTEEPAK